MTDLPPNTAPTIRVTAMPADANPYGDIFGGWLMGQMDLAAGSVASRRSGGRAVTIAADAMTFHMPVVVGDELTVATVMSATGSFDHRAIDGADGAQFMKAFKHLVENPLGMLA